MAEIHPGAPVALTGGTGFVGRRLQRSLIDAGLIPRVLVRPGSANAGHVLDGSESLQVALDDRIALADAVQDCAAVIYCAGSVRGRRPADFHAANVAGIEALIEALTGRATPPPVLLISSLAASRPQLSDYAASKHLGERCLAAYPGPWTALRPTAIYGPGDRELRPLFALMRRGIVPATGPRGQRLSFLHVDDLAAAVLAWLQHWPACRDGIFPLHDGRPNGYDWRDIGHAVAGRPVSPIPVPQALLALAAHGNRLLSSLIGYAPMLTPGKLREINQPDWLADNSEFTAATGWTPTIDLATGVARLFAAPADRPIANRPDTH